MVVHFRLRTCNSKVTLRILEHFQVTNLRPYLHSPVEMLTAFIESTYIACNVPQLRMSTALAASVVELGTET
jgi:hypothetical protein